jgi:hypothetical protein
MDSRIVLGCDDQRIERRTEEEWSMIVTQRATRRNEETQKTTSACINEKHRIKSENENPNVK